MKLPKKRTKILSKLKAYAETLGKLEAEAHFKNTKKGWLKSLRDHIGKAIDRLDPLETAAVIGLTYLIKQVIIENFETQIIKLVTGGGGGLLYIARLLSPELNRYLTAVEKRLEQALDQPNIELIEWLISFTIAYVIVKHGGALFTMLGEGAKSLTGIVGLFLGT